MKKPKSIVTKAVLGVVTSGILVASCSTEEYNLDDSIYGPFADNPATRGMAMLDIRKSNLSEQFISKLQVINSIVGEIMSDRKAAKAFSEDPDAYMASQETSLKITLSEQERALLFAFTDDEIIKAVKENDLESFLRVAREKGYIGLISDTYGPQDIKAMFKTEEEYRQFIKYITGDPDGEIVVQTVVATFFLYAVAVAVQYGAAATIAAIEVGAVYGVGVYWGHGGESSSSSRIVANNREPVLKIWTDSNGLMSDTSLYDEIIDKQVKKISDIIINEYPNADQDFVNEILRINLEGYYGLRK